MNTTIKQYSKPWSRAILLVDMNAFFASIEQYDEPALRNKPVAITNGIHGTCIITASYEARAHGIKTGMRIKEARSRCVDLIQCPSRPERYAEISHKIMLALHNITPDIEIFSVDEAFLDLTHCQKLHGSPIRMGQMVQQLIYDTCRLPCSIGISGDKTTAKFAAKLKKPNGFTIVPPWEAKQCLYNVPVTELCGIARGIADFLSRYGVYTCGDMQHLPISILSKRFGNIGRRIWYMCQGADPAPVKTTIDAPKTMGHGKVMPPNTTDKRLILTYLLHMSEKLAARLRRHDLKTQQVFIGLRSTFHGWLGGKYRIAYPTDDSRELFSYCETMLKEHWRGQGVSQVQVTALDPKTGQQQLDLFTDFNNQRHLLNKVVDMINDCFGEFAVSPARLLNRACAPNVISPAWQPQGPKQSIYRDSKNKR